MKSIALSLIASLIAVSLATPVTSALSVEELKEIDGGVGDTCNTSIPGLVDCVNDLYRDAYARYGSPTVQYVLTMCENAMGHDCIRVTPADRAGAVDLRDVTGLVGCNTSIPGLVDCVFYLYGDAWNRYGEPTVTYVMTICENATGKPCDIKIVTISAALVAGCDTSIPGLRDCVLELYRDAWTRYAAPTVAYAMTMCSNAMGKPCRIDFIQTAAAVDLLGDCNTSVPGLRDCVLMLYRDAWARYGAPTMAYVYTMCNNALGNCPFDEILDIHITAGDLIPDITTRDGTPVLA